MTVSCGGVINAKKGQLCDVLEEIEAEEKDEVVPRDFWGCAASYCDKPSNTSKQKLITLIHNIDNSRWNEIKKNEHYANIFYVLMHFLARNDNKIRTLVPYLTEKDFNSLYGDNDKFGKVIEKIDKSIKEKFKGLFEAITKKPAPYFKEAKEQRYGTTVNSKLQIEITKEHETDNVDENTKQSFQRTRKGMKQTEPQQQQTKQTDKHPRNYEAISDKYTEIIRYAEHFRNTYNNNRHMGLNLTAEHFAQALGHDNWFYNNLGKDLTYYYDKTPSKLLTLKELLEAYIAYMRTGKSSIQPHYMVLHFVAIFVTDVAFTKDYKGGNGQEGQMLQSIQKTLFATQGAAVPAQPQQSQQKNWQTPTPSQSWSPQQQSYQYYQQPQQQQYQQTQQYNQQQTQQQQQYAQQQYPQQQPQQYYQQQQYQNWQQQQYQPQQYQNYQQNQQQQPQQQQYQQYPQNQQQQKDPPNTPQPQEEELYDHEAILNVLEKVIKMAKRLNVSYHMYTRDSKTNENSLYLNVAKMIENNGCHLYAKYYRGTQTYASDFGELLNNYVRIMNKKSADLKTADIARGLIALNSSHYPVFTKNCDGKGEGEPSTESAVINTICEALLRIPEKKTDTTYRPPEGTFSKNELENFKPIYDYLQPDNDHAAKIFDVFAKMKQLAIEGLSICNIVSEMLPTYDKTTGDELFDHINPSFGYITYWTFGEQYKLAIKSTTNELRDFLADDPQNAQSSYLNYLSQTYETNYNKYTTYKASLLKLLTDADKQSLGSRLEQEKVNAKYLIESGLDKFQHEYEIKARNALDIWTAKTNPDSFPEKHPVWEKLKAYDNNHSLT